MKDILLKKLSKELTLQEKWKDGEWLQEQVVNGTLHSLFLDYLSRIIKILDEVYIGKWSMDIDVKRFDNLYNLRNCRSKIELYISPVILYENITIKNSQKKSLNIKNIFVKIPLNLNIGKLHFNGIQGRRGSLSYNEYSQTYFHSHLPKFKKEEPLMYQSFCTGSGEINFMTSKLNNEYTDSMFKTLLFHLQGYLEWESLEGRPHISLNDLFLKSKSNDLAYYSNQHCEQFVQNIIQDKKIVKKKFDINEIDLDWYFIDGLYRIKDNNKLEEFCKWKTSYINNELIKLEKKDYTSGLICYKDETGNYYPSNATIDTITIPDDYIPFKGKKYKLEVTGVLDDSNRPFFIHPKIKKYVREYLEYIVNKNKIRESIATTTH